MPEPDASADARSGRFRRLRTRWKVAVPVIVLALAAVFVLITGGIGWYFAGILRDDALAPDHDPDALHLEVVALMADRITLRAAGAGSHDDWTRDGRYGLEWEGGYAFVGAIVERRDGEVVRTFASIAGAAPQPGERVRLDGFAFPGDPLEAHVLPFEDIAIDGELGPLPAWLVPGARTTWAVFVHGKGADRREGLRILPALAAVGLPVLLISYRNDEGAPASDDGYYRYGLEEWRDLEAAVQFAIDRGAEEVVLIGYSMGGAIAIAFIERSPLAARVGGLILDAPVLSFEATVDFGAKDRGVPGFVIWAGKQFASRRFDVDWGAADYRATARALEVPVLLFHGSADEKTPVAKSDALAAARPDIVAYIRVEDAHHARAWNVDPNAYEAAVGDYLRELLRD